MDSFWKALPFDDLQHYQELGYNVKTGWLLVAMIAGTIIGVTAGLRSQDFGNTFFGVLLASVFVALFVGLYMHENKLGLKSSEFNYYQYIHMHINNALVSSCAILVLFFTFLSGTICEGIEEVLD